MLTALLRWNAENGPATRTVTFDDATRTIALPNGRVIGIGHIRPWSRRVLLRVADDGPPWAQGVTFAEVVMSLTDPEYPAIVILPGRRGTLTLLAVDEVA